MEILIYHTIATTNFFLCHLHCAPSLDTVVYCSMSNTVGLPRLCRHSTPGKSKIPVSVNKSIEQIFLRGRAAISNLRSDALLARYDNCLSGPRSARQARARTFRRLVQRCARWSLLD